MKKHVSKAIILGAVWGIFEATVGYLLHRSGLRIGSMIWFPIAYYFTHRAHRDTGSLSAAMLTAFVAASLKLINLFFPGRIDTVVNPAVSILLEAFAVVLVYRYVTGGRAEKITPLTVALSGFLWRGLYICYLFAMPQGYFDRSSLTTTESFLSFFFVKNVINIAIIWAGFLVAERAARQFEGTFAGRRAAVGRRAAIGPALAAGSALLAVIAQIALR